MRAGMSTSGGARARATSRGQRRPRGRRPRPAAVAGAYERFIAAQVEQMRREGAPEWRIKGFLEQAGCAVEAKS